MDNDIIDPNGLLFSKKEEPFTPPIQGFARLFADATLDPLTNTNDLIDMDNIKDRYHRPLNGETYSFSDVDNPFLKISHKEDFGQNQGSLPFLSHSPATYFNTNMSFNANNNAKYNNSQESLGLTPVRATKKYSDDYYAPYDSNFENSNPRPFGEFQTSQELVDNNTSDYPLSLVWNHEKALQQKTTGANDLFMGERKMSFGPSFIAPTFPDLDDIEDNEEGKGHEYADTVEIEGPNNRIFQNNEAKPHRDFERFFHPRIEPSTVSSSVNNTGKKDKLRHDSDQNGYYKTGSFDLRDNGKSTPASKGDDDEDNDGLLGSDHRSSRGLRVLSVKVKDIVGEKRTTSYKEVADDLIAEFSNKFKTRKPGEAKDEQNVKRRVYDALNVLIAADILKKDGKTVFCDEDLSNIGPPKKKQLKEEINKIEHDINRTNKRSRQKLEVVRELVSKCLALKGLIERNKDTFTLESSNGQSSFLENKLEDIKKEEFFEEKEGKASKKKGKKSKSKGKKDSKENEENAENKKVTKSKGKILARLKEDEIVRFPFITLVSSAKENMMSLNMDNSKMQLLIESKNPLNLYGDLDILLKLKLHYVSEEFFNETIPEEMHKYVIKAYDQE